VKSKFKSVKEDPDDDTIIRASYDSKANYITSGDRHLLALKQFKGIRIVNVDEMLNTLNN
jgi:predicted nucleic acid-binding protein